MFVYIFLLLEHLVDGMVYLYVRFCIKLYVLYLIVSPE
jgi:hypothetical protein